MSPDVDMTAQHDSRYSWIRLAVSLAIAVVGNIGMWAIIVALPAVQAEFGTGRADASLPYTMTMVGFAFGNLLIGRAVDKWGVAPVLAISALVQAAGFAIAAQAGSITTLSGAQIVIGFASAACFGPLIADISHWFMRRRGVAVAIAASGNYLSGALWPMALSTVLIEDGWRASYNLLALALVGIMFPMCFALRRNVSSASHNLASQAATRAAHSVAFSPRNLQIILAVAGVSCCVAMSMPQVHIVAYCVDLGYGPAVGAEMLSLMLLGGVASRLVSGVLADRIGGVWTLLIGSSLQCLALFLYLPTAGLTPLYLVSLVFGLSQGGIVPSYAIIVREYMPPREAGTRVGVVIFATIVGMALGGWMSGWIFDMTGSYQMAFLNGIGWNVLNIALIALIFFRSRNLRAATA